MRQRKRRIKYNYSNQQEKKRIREKRNVTKIAEMAASGRTRQPQVEEVTQSLDSFFVTERPGSRQQKIYDLGQDYDSSSLGSIGDSSVESEGTTWTKMDETVEETMDR